MPNYNYLKAKQKVEKLLTDHKINSVISRNSFTEREHIKINGDCIYALTLHNKTKLISLSTIVEFDSQNITIKCDEIKWDDIDTLLIPTIRWFISYTTKMLENSNT